MISSILIADGEGIFRNNLKEYFRKQGFEAIDERERNNVLKSFRAKKPDIVVLGSFNRDSHDGLNLARLIRKQDRKIPIILLVNQSSEALAVAALKIGVNDYFKAPFSTEALIESTKKILSGHRTKTSAINDREMIGNSLPMREIKDYLSRIAASDSTVLVTGETGTGKELVASLIHRNSARQKKPFVCINCAALPDSLLESEMFGFERGAFTGAVARNPGKFELAQGGTVFLDEIADMNPHAQAKILRTIENKEIHRLGGSVSIPLNVRIAAATNQDPERLIEEGTFREDLYYRLNVARVHLPPLRNRKEDIPKLVSHLIEDMNGRFGRDIDGLTEDAMASLFQHDWPGNVRELKNLLEAAFINLPSRKITFMDLPKAFRKRLRELEASPKKERDRVLSALFATNWNKSKAAQKLRWSRMTLYRKMVQYQIKSNTKSERYPS